jgi:HAMP domain-containing protein/HPt (histidine-containing phosphotransfer) domain-containing protein
MIPLAKWGGPNRSPLLTFGIQAKLFMSFTSLLAMALALVFFCLMTLDSRRAAEDLKKAEHNIRGMIVNKGKQLTLNGSIAMRSLAEENSISTIREIIASTVDGDSDIVYGIFMDPESNPWAVRERLRMFQDIDLRNPMRDSMSHWAAGSQSLQYRSRDHAGTEILEFAIPVRKGDERLGTIRFGLTTKSMHEAFRSAKTHSGKVRRQTTLLFLLVAVFAFLIALGASTFVAARMTRPITVLNSSASRIAGGDYEERVPVAGEDEIGVLAQSFESMRLKIKDYMQNLQALVEMKVRQIRDILENIEQGLFTFNLDLEVNKDSSKKAAVILGLPDFAGRTLADLLRLTPKQVVLFRDWIDIVRNGEKTQRWRKLSRLAPLHEIRIENGDEVRYVVLEYQKILDHNGVLSRIMVLARDVTEARKTERRLQEEKIRHEKTVKTVLGISSHSPETITQFMRDTDERMQAMEKSLEAIGEARDGMRHDLAIGIFKECHTIKGDAGAFGFDSLAAAAENMEGLLQASVSDAEGWETRIRPAGKLLETMMRENSDINEIFHILAGKSGEATVRLVESKVANIRHLADAIGDRPLDPDVSELVASCRRISYRSFLSLSKKYRDLVENSAFKAGKEVDFMVIPPDLEMDHSALAGIDEALVHLFRNAVAHGIESFEERAKGKKGKGKIEFHCSLGRDGSHVFSIEDNGPGIDIGSLSAKAVNAGVITQAAVAAMTDQEKLELVFSQGLSTSSVSDSLSGRGLGMAIAAECVRAAGGKILLESWPGQGTRFTIAIPA